MVTREAATEQLKSLGVESPTDEQITAYLNNVNAEAIKEQNKAKNLKDKADKADELQKQLDEINQNGLSDLEKANKSNEALQNQIKELQNNSFKSEAKAILSKSGLDDADVDALIPGMVAGLDKVEDVQARANAYAGTIGKVRENAIKEKEKNDLNGTKTPGGNPGGDENKTSAAKYAETLVKANGSDSKDSGSIISNYK